MQKESLEEQIVGELYRRGLTITTAESCTGGLLSGRLINAAGASDVLNEGYITYSNEAKERILGVSHRTLESYGAVSCQTAEEMASGAAHAAKADIAMTTTGIAGPGGGTAAKPVGLVYIGCYIKGEVTSVECHFSGSRSEVRLSSVETALHVLLDRLKGAETL